jgi:hypothetical protein
MAVLPALPVLSISTASLPAFAINSTTASAPQSFTFSALNLLAPLDINVGTDFRNCQTIQLATKILGALLQMWMVTLLLLNCSVDTNVQALVILAIPLNL